MAKQKVVTRGGISGTAHTVHLILTFCTCGLWGVVWFLHWLFTRSKTVTRIPEQPVPPMPQPYSAPPAQWQPPASAPPQQPPGPFPPGGPYPPQRRP